MPNKQPKITDVQPVDYIPDKIRTLLTNYEGDPGSLSNRQAIFTKLYNDGGDERKLAEGIAGNAQGYEGLSQALINAYYTPDTPLNAVGAQLSKGLLGRKLSKNNDVPNLDEALASANMQQEAQEQPQEGSPQETTWNRNMGVFGNAGQNGFMRFLTNG